MTQRRPPGGTLLAAGLLSLALTACDDPPQRRQETFLAFGTLVDVTLYGVPQQRAAEAIAEIEDDFRYMHRTYHAWRPGALGRVNRLLPTGEDFSAPPSVLPLIREAKRLSARTDGLFNPAIGRLIELWGFHQDARPDTAPPERAEIDALVAKAPSMDDLVVHGIRLRSRNPAVKLDFGAFAKGYGVDAAIDTLRELGIEDAMVNAGGDLRAIGRAGDRPWRVGVRHPRGRGVLAAVELHDGESVFTSGDYERYFEHEGQRYHHIIDPRTGYPARETTSVTVIGAEGATADAAATALFVAGPGGWKDIARALDLEYVMLIDHDGEAYLTPAMAGRVEWVGAEPAAVHVSAPP
ncbi:MAG: FAD:protein FMN transferase [Gammaproteobacteria bacterium]|nr:FAD:protein FMN transferase [Gammaproteobacteria bacterium]